MLDQPNPQRTSTLQRDSRLLFQEVFGSSRKSVHRLNSTFELSVPLALALGRCFRHNLAVPTILDSVTEGNNAGELGMTLLYLMKSRSAIRALHPSTAPVTPDAFTLAISHDEHWKCVMCSVFWLPTEPVIHRDSRCLFCLLRFRVNWAMIK